MCFVSTYRRVTSKPTRMISVGYGRIVLQSIAQENPE